MRDGETRAPHSATAGPATSSRSARILAALAVLLTAVIVVSGLLAALAHRHAAQHNHAEQDRAAAALAAVRTFTDLTTVDYRQPGDYATRVGRDTTGPLHDQVTTGAGDIFRTAYEPDQEVLTSAVSGVGVTVGPGSTATALVLGQVTVSSVAAPSGRTDTSGYELTLRKVGGVWLTEEATPITGNDVTDATAGGSGSAPPPSAPASSTGSRP